MSKASGCNFNVFQSNLYFLYMTDIFITDPSPFEEDINVEKSLRPLKFDEFIG